MGKSFFNGFFAGFVVAVFTVAVFTIVFKEIISTTVRGAEPAQRYFATSAKGQLVELKPLDEPELSTAATINWLGESLTSSFTFGFHDYNRRHREAKALYSDEAWVHYQETLKRNGMMQHQIEDLHMVVTAALQSSPVLLQEGAFNSKWRTVFRVPIVLTTKSGRRSMSTVLDTTVTVERVDLSVNPSGLKIVEFMAI